MSDAATNEPTDQPVEPQATEQGDPADEPLGEPGKKALDAERQRARELEKQLNAATARLTEIERANETALERAQREAAEAREAVAAATAEALRFKVAAKHGITDEDAELFLTGTDEATLLRQAARLTERTTPSGPRPDPTQGGSDEPPALNSNALEEALKAKLGIT